MLRCTRNLRTDRRGVTALEYGLIASVLFASVLIGFNMMATQLSNQFTAISTCLTNGLDAAGCISSGGSSSSP